MRLRRLQPVLMISKYRRQRRLALIQSQSTCLTDCRHAHRHQPIELSPSVAGVSADSTMQSFHSEVNPSVQRDCQQRDWAGRLYQHDSVIKRQCNYIRIFIVAMILRRQVQLVSLVGWSRERIVTKQLDGSRRRSVYTVDGLGQRHILLDEGRKHHERGTLGRNYMLA